MSRPKLPWLERESTNRDALILGGIFSVVPLLLGALDATGVFTTLPLAAWVGVAVAAVLVALAFMYGRTTALRGMPKDVERYAEHTSDALDTLQKVLTGVIPRIGLRDFVQEGIFEPAHTILTQGNRGDVRFSVLVRSEAESDEFKMIHALGHDADSRRRFRLKIAGSFAGLAFTSGEMRYSNDTDADNRFERHPRARPGREYGSIVAVPVRMKDEVCAVFVVIAARKEAFSATDRGYIQILASIVAVAWAAVRASRKREPRLEPRQTGGTVRDPR